MKNINLVTSEKMSIIDKIKLSLFLRANKVDTKKINDIFKDKYDFIVFYNDNGILKASSVDTYSMITIK